MMEPGSFIAQVLLFGSVFLGRKGRCVVALAVRSGQPDSLVVLVIDIFVAWLSCSLPGVEVVDDGPHQVLERIRRRKVESNLGGLLSNPRADF